MMKWHSRASHLGRFTLWYNSRRATTQLGRFTLGRNGHRATKLDRFTLWNNGRRDTQLGRFSLYMCGTTDGRRATTQRDKFTLCGRTAAELHNTVDLLCGRTAAAELNNPVSLMHAPGVKICTLYED